MVRCAIGRVSCRSSSSMLAFLLSNVPSPSSFTNFLLCAHHVFLPCFCRVNTPPFLCSSIHPSSISLPSIRPKFSLSLPYIHFLFGVFTHPVTFSLPPLFSPLSLPVFLSFPPVCPLLHPVFLLVPSCLPPSLPSYQSPPPQTPLPPYRGLSGRGWVGVRGWKGRKEVCITYSTLPASNCPSTPFSWSTFSTKHPPPTLSPHLTHLHSPTSTILTFIFLPILTFVLLPILHYSHLYSPL